MTFLELSRKVDEAVLTKGLEKVITFIRSLKTNDEKEISKELKKKFPKLDKDDIELAISLL